MIRVIIFIASITFSAILSYWVFQIDLGEGVLILPPIIFALAVTMAVASLIAGKWTSIALFISATLVLWFAVFLVGLGFLFPLFLTISERYAIPVMGGLAAIGFYYLYAKMILRQYDKWISLIAFILGYSSFLFPGMFGAETKIGEIEVIVASWQLLIGLLMCGASYKKFRRDSVFINPS